MAHIYSSCVHVVLLNNAAVKDYLNRLGFSEVTDWEYGEGRETVTHVLMECKLEQVARQELVDSVQELNGWNRRKYKF